MRNGRAAPNQVSREDQKDWKKGKQHHNTQQKDMHLLRTMHTVQHAK